MIKEAFIAFIMILLTFMIGIFVFILFVPYPLPVALRTLGSFLANFAIIDLINNSMFQIFLLGSLSFAFLLVIYYITVGNKRGNTFWPILLIPNIPMNNINMQYNEVWNPFNTMVSLADFFPYFMLFFIFLVFIWRVFTHERGVNRKGLL